jgi:hypothetical protein
MKCGLNGLFYCGKYLENNHKLVSAERNLDNQCGPVAGPQCEDCKGFSFKNPPNSSASNVGEVSIRKLEGGKLKLISSCCDGKILFTYFYYYAHYI